jgi:hypothetical protein
MLFSQSNDENNRCTYEPSSLRLYEKNSFLPIHGSRFFESNSTLDLRIGPVSSETRNSTKRKASVTSIEENQSSTFTAGDWSTDVFHFLHTNRQLEERFVHHFNCTNIFHYFNLVEISLESMIFCRT